jgi:hypothetical protein
MCRVHVIGLVFLGLAACNKPETKPEPIPTFQIVGTPQPAPEPSAAPSASATASATASAKPTASAKTAAAASGAPAVALKAASTHVGGKNFALDVASPGCRADTPCAMTIRLAATGDYHINKEYPYKFTASPAPNVDFLGSGDANTFSRGQGDFKEDGEKNATLTVRFKPKSAGEAKVSGTYKLSVCSAENCQIETQNVTLAVNVQ